MKSNTLLVLLVGFLVVAAPIARVYAAEAEAADEYGDDDDEAEAPAAPAEDDEKDVVVLTVKNFDDIVKKSKFALVRASLPAQGSALLDRLQAAG